MNTEKNPKKSKALIITFIVVLALLIGGYFLFTRTEILTKNGIVGKVFAPLLGTSKQKPVDTIGGTGTTGGTGTDGTGGGTTGGTGTDGTGGEAGGGTTGGTTGTGAGTGYSPYSPGFNPFPTPNTNYPNTPYTPKISTKTTQCNDGKDNDGDKFIDSADAGCHTDFDATNNTSYEPTLNSEMADGTNTSKKTTLTQCPSIDLVFSDQQKKDLAELTRQYYRIASTLHTEQDILAEKSAKKAYEDLTRKANSLTNQCYAEIKDPSFCNNLKPTMENYAELKDICNKSTYAGPRGQRYTPYYPLNQKDTDPKKYFLLDTYKNSVGLNEPVMKSLYYLTYIIDKFSDQTSLEKDTSYLKKVVNNIVGIDYGNGTALPTAPYNYGVDPNGYTFLGYTFQGGVFYFIDPKSDKLYPATDPKVAYHYLFDNFIYGEPEHRHSCEGYINYGDKKINDFFTEARRRIQVFYNYFGPSSPTNQNYMRTITDPSTLMSADERTACNQIYALKSILEKNPTVYDLKNWSSGSVCYYDRKNKNTNDNCYTDASTIQKNTTILLPNFTVEEMFNVW